MKVIYNRFIPIKGFSAINLFGVIFARKEYNPLSKKTINHEKIHDAQAKEFVFGYFSFYAFYLRYWLKFGYKNNPFEREAYDNDFKPRYLFQRERFAWEKYLNN